MGQVGTSSTATVSAILLLLLFTLKREKSQRYSNSFLYFKQVHYSPLKREYVLHGKGIFCD
ncbi:ORF148 [White spot syndrome virus]|uniref:Wsv082 n=3 Tax=White spot syndrome virus TaxID=342409 RepID=Q8VB98_WSSVS|nr:wsv082 [Shrimp white spot syndrome virus]AFX59459.1 wsv082 [White spot syndrome virus]AAL33086.1 wsv082 [Shrimp white spot syndrome virus]AAL89007.1 WSSV139 [Shrimp white spot syndrome virus]ATU84210.1 ORF148 [White spot syndrome virus]AWQ60271.1 wsv082 [Shrimp white spot syndrome virus]